MESMTRPVPERLEFLRRLECCRIAPIPELIAEIDALTQERDKARAACAAIWDAIEAVKSAGFTAASYRRVMEILTLAQGGAQARDGAPSPADPESKEPRERWELQQRERYEESKH